MTLNLGQLVFTSFVGVGFKTLSSAQVPTSAQQAFIKHIAHRYWDAHNPPEPGFRAAYLHQVSPEQTLFGWLYSEVTDDLGRDHVPYFLCYYLGETLQTTQLRSIFDCLEQGPVERLDRQIIPESLKRINLPWGCDYQSADPGVAVPMEVYLQSYVALNHSQLLNLFIPVHGGIVIEQKSLLDQSGFEPKPFGQTLSSQGSQELMTPLEQRQLVKPEIDLRPAFPMVKSPSSAILLKQEDPKKQDFKINLRTALLVIVGLFMTLGLGVYRLSQAQDWQAAYLLQSSKTLEQKRSYEVCITKLQAIPEDSKVYPEAQKLSNTCEAGSNWQNSQLRTLTGHRGTVWSVAISPNGKFLVSGSDDQTIKVWNLHTGKLLHTLTGHGGTVWSVAISPDGERLVSGSGNTIEIWNLRTGKLLHTLTGHEGTVWSVAISPDGERLASGSGNTIEIWNLRTGKLLHTLTGHQDRVRAIAMSPDGKFLVSGSGNTIEIWNLRTGKLLHTLVGHQEQVISVAISPDSRTIASGSQDKTLKVWDLPTGKLQYSLPESADWVNAVAISPNGNFLASGSGKITKIWNLHTGNLVHTLGKTPGDITSVAFSTSGKKLIGGTRSATIKIWQK